MNLLSSIMGKGGDKSKHDAVDDPFAGANTSQFVYIQSKDHAWQPGRLLETHEKHAVVELPTYPNEQAMQSDGGRHARGKASTVTVDLTKYPNKALPLQNVTPDGVLHEVEDMVDLPFLHEAAILYNLKARHVQSRPYTRTGDIVIAVNPYKWINELYTEKLRTYYSRTLVWSKTDKDARKGLAPHVYEASALAYRGLALDQQNQSILVSGESGAGKTETVKIAMNHIASVQRGFVSDADGAKGFTSPVVQRVLDSNPLLEAFGNAKTTRNDNSSRFGKYIQLQFDGEDPNMAMLQGKPMPACVLAGSKCEVYLLEKSRVVGHTEQERTYHIFYQLLAAPQQTKLDIWDGLKGTDNESFSYVGWTDTNMIEGKSDGEHFVHTLESLALIGVHGDKLKTLMRTICVVLQLGNLIFDPHPHDSERTAITSTEEFAMLANLMGIAPKELMLAFTERTVNARGEVIKTAITFEKAKDACDAFAKEIYARAFLWLVREINDATCAEKNYDGERCEEFGIIGLLDIFGFESFKINRFEQLCINYANEKLQQKFTQDIFQTVQEEYQFEGIELEEITYDDNTDVLDLIEGRGGFLAMLNEECFRPKGNDREFVAKAIAGSKHSPALIATLTYDYVEFGIQHYAGPVTYNADGFVVKNTDNIPADLKECARKSSIDIIANHLENDEMMNTGKPGDAPRRVVPRRPGSTRGGNGAASSTPSRNKQNNIVGETVWTKFKSQLTSLMDTLGTTRTRYIRCIKPNTVKRPLQMEHLSTIEQLRCAGVVAAVTISRSAFPNRLDHQVALDRFKSLWPRGKPRSEEGYYDERNKEDVETLLTSALRQLEVKKEGKKVQKAFVIGRTRAYFRAGALEFLETKRMDGMGFWAAQMQKIVRGFLARTEYQRQRKAAIQVQKRIRLFVTLRKYRRMRKRSIQIQCWYRCLSAKRLVARKRVFHSATKVQIRWKIFKAVAYLQKHRVAIAQIQRIARGAVQRPRYRQALQDKKDEADMQKRLEKMQHQMEEAEKHRNDEMARIQELGRRQLEEERASMRKEMEEMEKQRMAMFIQQQVAAAMPPPAPVSPVAAAPAPVAPAAAPKEDVRVVEVIKYIEERKDDAAMILTAEQQELMEESGKIIEFLRNENMKHRKKNDQMKKDFVNLKENNLRLMEANASAGASFQALNQHAKQLNGTNQKLLKTVAQFKNKNAQLHLDMKTRQNYYKEISSAYEEEKKARAFYERAMIDIVDMVNQVGQNPALIKFAMKKASECAMVSKKVTGSAPELEDSETSA